MPHILFRGETIPLDGYKGRPHGAGYVYVCATCGDAWGKFLTESVGFYIITAMPCPEHGKTVPFHSVGGSFRYPARWRDGYVPANGEPWKDYPDGLLRHEALMLSNHILKDPK